jgi:catechol 2,3-dioxygenase-like lactoylglutathione lyase family enzyme
VRLCHLSLAVTDPERSRRFYERYLGFACDGEPDAEGCLHLSDAEDFDLTPAPATTALEDGVPAGDLYEDEGKVAFQCSDPDGYRVEVFWSAVNPRRPGPSRRR